MEAGEFKIKIFTAGNKLYRFAKRMLGNSEEAEDAVQEVFLKLWTQRKKLDNIMNLDAYAMTMMKNHCIDSIRAAKTKVLTLNEEIVGGAVPNPHRKAELTDTKELIENIIRELPETQKMSVQLRDIEGYSYDEIEEISGMTRNAIKVNLSRARSKIRDKLKKVIDYEK